MELLNFVRQIVYRSNIKGAELAFLSGSLWQHGVVDQYSIFLNKARSGLLPITDSKMTRFNISLNEGVDMVLWALNNALGGEILVPKIPSYLITDLAEAIGPGCKKHIIGIRPGEKIHEEMITVSDSFSTIDLGSYYAIEVWFC